MYNKQTKEIMKVSVTLTETVTYEITKELELTPAQYATYCKTGKLPNNKATEIEHELSGLVDDEHWITTEDNITHIEKI